MEASPPGQGSPLSSLLPSASVPESMTIRKYFLSRLHQRRHAMAVPLFLPLRDCRLCEAQDKGRCVCPWSWTWECVTVGLLGHGEHVACRCVHAQKDTLQEWSHTELEGNLLVFRVLERCRLQKNCPSWVSSVTPSALLPVSKERCVSQR